MQKIQNKGVLILLILTCFSIQVSSNKLSENFFLVKISNNRISRGEAGFTICSVLNVPDMETTQATGIKICNDHFYNMLHPFLTGKFPVGDTVRLHAAMGDCSQGYIVNHDTAVCSGSVVDLSSRKALTYHWYPENYISKSFDQNPYVIIDTTRTFFLETTDMISNLVVNPGFEMGNTGFETDYTYCNTENCLWPMGDNGYSVGKDAEYYLTGYFAGHDHTSGSGNFLIINGGRPTLKVWRQTIAVDPGKEYTLGFWLSRLNELDTAKIRFSVNGAQLGTVEVPPLQTNVWKQVVRTWNSGSHHSAIVEIADMNPAVLGNDFGIDDIFFGELTACIDSIKITASKNVKLGPDTLITPPDQQLVLNAMGGLFSDYRWNTGENTPSITINKPGTYWIVATDEKGCVSHDTILVKNARGFLVFPNAFTPDANQHNDFFCPVGSNVSTFHMWIFDRWGQVIFETDNMNQGWDGKSKGETCPSGLYIYTASYELQPGTGIKTQRGAFTLLR